MNRKLVAILLSAFLVVACASCGDGEEPSNSPSGSGAPVTESVTPETDETGTGTLGDYDVTISGASLTEDYDGNTALVVTFTWTNNSEDTTSAMVALVEQAFQDGVELENAFIVDSDAYDSEADMKEIRPGASLEVQCAFVLDSDTSPVEVEISELFSFDDAVVTKTFDPSAL